mgnify:CR=1 FL=1
MTIQSFSKKIDAILMEDISNIFSVKTISTKNFSRVYWNVIFLDKMKLDGN